MASESFTEFLSRGQALLEDLFPGVLLMDAVEYACVNSGARTGNELEEGGFVENGTRQCRVLKSAMAVPPAIGEMVELDGEEVRCLAVAERDWDVAWNIELEPLRAS
jgi:hypothetical protein